MSAIVFPYIFYYGMYSPIIPIGIKSSSGWKKVWAYVDSGSIYSILRQEEAESLNIDTTDGEKIFIKVGDGDTIPIYLHTMLVQISHQRFESVIGFSDRLKVGFNIIGRYGIFNRFRICFDDLRHIVSLEPKSKKIIGDRY